MIRKYLKSKSNGTETKECGGVPERTKGTKNKWKHFRFTKY